MELYIAFGFLCGIAVSAGVAVCWKSMLFIGEITWVQTPFRKTGNTVVFLAASTAPTPVQAVSTTLGGNQYRIINSGLVTVFLGYGANASAATSSATVVTTSGPAIPLLPGTDEILTFVPNAYFTGITVSGTANVYVTPGDGA
jgi:hypothetical protein